MFAENVVNFEMGDDFSNKKLILFVQLRVRKFGRRSCVCSSTLNIIRVSMLLSHYFVYLFSQPNS